jgi:hypothetical protein
MNRFRKVSRRNPRSARVAAGVLAAGAAVLVAACSSSSSGGPTTSPASGGASTGASSTSSSANLSALAGDVNQGAAIPSFSTYASGYGSKVPTTGLSGKKLMIVPGDSALAACTEIAQADAALATAVGMQPTIFANQGTEAEYDSAFEDAIHGGYAAIDAGCDFDPTLVAPQIAAAQKAGIVVSVYGATPQEAAAIAGIAGIAYAGTNGTVDPTAGSALILPAYAAFFLGTTAVKVGRINALGAFIAVYFLATGTAGLELLGEQSYIQQIFYGAALVAAITVPKVTRDRIFRKRRTA